MSNFMGNLPQKTQRFLISFKYTLSSTTFCIDHFGNKNFASELLSKSIIIKILKREKLLIVQVFSSYFR